MALKGLKKRSLPNKLVLFQKVDVLKNYKTPKKYSIPKLVVLDLLFVTIALCLISKGLKPY